MKWPLALVLLPFAAMGQEIRLTEGLGRTIPGNMRSPARRDTVEHALLNGKALDGPEWSAAKANAQGVFGGQFTSSGYLKFSVNLLEAKAMFLEAVGNSMVYVNGEPRGGDIYMFGYVSVPVALKKGNNELLFALGRGQFQGRLVDAPKPLSIDLRDSTTPDVTGAEKESLAAIVVRNATDSIVDDLTLVAGKFRTPVGRILPMSTVKAGFRIPMPTDGKVNLRLERKGKVQDNADLTLRKRKPSEPHKITFRSKIDGSVQYYAVQPCTEPGPGKALFLSLHGASVEASGQAEAYSAKNWGTVVAATNRRPFGFNWEDQGRLDALEVLELAKARFKPNERQIYLTGHSMGGHGTWQLGAHFPDQWAAIAPAAGWVSYWSYAGGANYPNPSEIEKILLGGMSPSDTLKLAGNYAQHGVFILHGDADETVPVSEAKTMAAELGKFHKSWDMALVPGAGHWWDNDPEAGADAVDDARLFRFFARHQRPTAKEVTEVNFTTADPGVSNACHWVTIDAQERVRDFSQVKLVASPHLRQIKGTTTNVGLLTLRSDALIPGGKWLIELDGTKLALPFTASVTLVRDGSEWRVRPAPAQLFRHGFKSMFDRNFAFVVSDNHDWTWPTARYLNEQWRIIANGRVDILRQSELTDKVRDSRNLVYITSDKTLLPEGFGAKPVVLTHWSKGRQVGVIFGGPVTTRIPYFTAGAHIPDYFEFTDGILIEGTKGVTRTGFWVGQDEKK